MTLEEFKKRSKRMPDKPGVYFFLDRSKKILYIGKAASLRDRVRSYFAADIAEVRSPLIASVVQKAKNIDWRQTDSVLEALILEANLIKHHKPKGNTDSKDDKSWNYVVITKEEYPRVLLVRGRTLEQEFPSKDRSHLFGPYPHGMQLKEALRIVRKIFSYRDKCTPGAGRACFNRELGLCPGVCTGEVSASEYRKLVRRIAMLFAGKKKELLRSMERDMKRLAKEERFEDAQAIRTQLFALKHIQDISLIKEEYRSPSGISQRIEAYDIAHLGGSAAVGVMTVVEGGVANKAEYRKFRLRQAKGGDDVGALREVLARRLGHDEWPMPRLIAVDGSTAQINAAKRVLDEYGIRIPVVGVVKDERHRPRGIQGPFDATQGKREGITPALERDILLANAEAHRFAISYHRKRARSERGI